MAHWSKPSRILASSLVVPTSRYMTSQVREYTDKQLLVFETYKRRPRMILGTEQWLEIPREMAYRPDLVATEVYGAPDLWWSIMEFNGMKDILEFKAGVNIRLPGNILA